MKTHFARLTVTLLLLAHICVAAAPQNPRLPPMKVSPEANLSAAQMKAFRQRVEVAFGYCGIDPDLAAIVKKRNIVLAIVPDASEEFLSPLKIDPAVKKAIKTKTFKLNSFAVLETAGVNQSPRYTIYLDESLVTAPAMETVANMTQQLVAIKLMSEGNVPQKMGARQVKIYQLSIKSLEVIHKKVSTESGNTNPTVIKALQRQIEMEKKTLAAWEGLAAVTEK
jgi:hypothetical protein